MAPPPRRRLPRPSERRCCTTWRHAQTTCHAHAHVHNVRSTLVCHARARLAPAHAHSVHTRYMPAHAHAHAHTHDNAHALATCTRAHRLPTRTARTRAPPAQALLASKPHHGAGSAANRSAAEALWRRLRAAVELADTSTADEAGTTLIAHAPGTYPQRPAAEAVPQGVAALRACWRAALRHPVERLDLAVIAHCACGWSAGGDGAQRFGEWCAAAAPNGGRVAFHWPGPACCKRRLGGAAAARLATRPLGTPGPWVLRAALPSVWRP